MGHKNSDMDCLGAALGVMTCANHVGTHAYIVLDAVNNISDAGSSLITIVGTKLAGKVFKKK